MNKVFVYGIFTDVGTRESILGEVSAEYAELEGYGTRTHSQVPYLTVYENDNDFVQGLLLEVSDSQLKKMDRVEGKSFGLYRREKIKDFWVYME